MAAGGGKKSPCDPDMSEIVGAITVRSTERLMSAWEPEGRGLGSGDKHHTLRIVVRDPRGLQKAPAGSRMTIVRWS